MPTPLTSCALLIAALAAGALPLEAQQPTPPPASRPPREVDLSGRGVAPGDRARDQPYFEFQVEKPVTPLPGSGGPRYPEILKSANVQGTVLLQFVVDTLGRVDTTTVKTLRSDHELFTAAVRSALPTMRFTPAEVGGRKVKQLVQQPYEFALTGASSAPAAPRVTGTLAAEGVRFPYPAYLRSALSGRCRPGSAGACCRWCCG